MADVPSRYTHTLTHKHAYLYIYIDIYTQRPRVEDRRRTTLKLPEETQLLPTCSRNIEVSVRGVRRVRASSWRRRASEKWDFDEE